MSVSDDRWTCPRCERTTVVIGSQADVRAALDSVRSRHYGGHRSGDEVLEEMSLAGAGARTSAKQRRANYRAAARRHEKAQS